MLHFVLSVFLGYVTFFHPVIRGAQLCRLADPDPDQVTNLTLALIFGWVMEVADFFFLSSFIAMRSLYLCTRIVLCMYFAHPQFLGALHTYEKVFASAVEYYAPLVDAILLQHVAALGDWGAVKYATTMGMSLLRGVVEIMAIAQQLLRATMDTSIPPAALPRRFSQVREGRLTGSSGPTGSASEAHSEVKDSGKGNASPATLRPEYHSSHRMRQDSSLSYVLTTPVGTSAAPLPLLPDQRNSHYLHVSPAGRSSSSNSTASRNTNNGDEALESGSWAVIRRDRVASNAVRKRAPRRDDGI